MCGALARDLTVAKHAINTSYQHHYYCYFIIAFSRHCLKAQITGVGGSSVYVSFPFAP